MDGKLYISHIQRFILFLICMKNADNLSTLSYMMRRAGPTA